MPRGEGGYKSRNKTKDGKNKSWIGFDNGKITRKYADGYEKGEGGVATKKKAAAKPKAKAAAKPKSTAKVTRPKARNMDSSPKPVGRKDSNKAKGKVKAPVAVGGARAAMAGSSSRKASRTAGPTRPKARPAPKTASKRTRGSGGKGKSLADKLNGNTSADRKKIAAGRQAKVKNALTGKTTGSKARRGGVKGTNPMAKKTTGSSGRRKKS